MDSMLFLAMAPPAGGGSTGTQSPMFMVGWMVIMVGIFYFLMIRPQRKKEKERQDLIKSIKTGDKILFSGGIIGIVANVKEKTLAVRVSDKTKLEVLRSAVTQVIDKGELPADVDQETLTK